MTIKVKLFEYGDDAYVVVGVKRGKGFLNATVVDDGNTPATIRSTYDDAELRIETNLTEEQGEGSLVSLVGFAVTDNETIYQSMKGDLLSFEFPSMYKGSSL